MCAGLCACEKKASSTSSTSAGESTAASSTTAGGAKDVCKLFTSDEMGALAGSKIVDSKLATSTRPGEATCDWLSKDGGIVVALTVVPTTKAAFTSGAEGYQAVSGIGDKAYQNQGILTVLNGTTEIAVIFGGSGSVETQKKIAAAAIQKLGK